MSTFETSSKSLLQGVSQQLSQERLPGQLSAQVNMISDPVTNLRRRHGVVNRAVHTWTGATTDNIVAWFADVAGARIHIYLNTTSGQIRVFDENYALVATLNGATSYLGGSTPSEIRVASVGNEFFFGNMLKVPSVQRVTSGTDPKSKGFFYVLAGAFSKAYNVTVAAAGGTTYTATYTTPSGGTAGDAALATPEYIATQLTTALTTNAGGSWTVNRDGPYVFITGTNTSAQMNVTSSSGDNYLIASKGGVVTSTGQLPARLPSQGNNYICRVGTGQVPQYFQYNHSLAEWLEVAKYGSVSSITNCPISMYWNGSAWTLDTSAFEGSTAGDDTSNPLHTFMTDGLTGMGTYQGRLVLMSGPMVSLSSAKEPRRFFRSTITSVVNSDAIEIGSGMSSAAAYEWAVPFQKDLILFSQSSQAVIPSANTAITPGNATVVATSAHEVDTTGSPVIVGRTLMYCNPRSEDFFGILEMIPSPYTDSQYVSQDSTPHLPRYMPGRCRFAVSSGIASIALFAPTGDKNTLIVHEYHWDGDTKVQQAWHQWLFEYPVAAAYFAGDLITLVFVNNNTVLLGSVDPRSGAVAVGGERRPYLDLNVSATITNHNIPIPASLTSLDPAIAGKLVAVVASGPMAGEVVGTTVANANNLTTVLSWPSGTVKLGLPYYSGFVPSQPIITDYKEGIIHTGKATLLRYIVGTANSSEYEVRVDDDYSMGDPSDVPTLTWTSPELQLGQALYPAHSVAVIPCRTDLRSTQMEVWTEAPGELNLTSLEYVAKFNPKITRR